MKKVFFLLNSLREFNFSEYIAEHLNGVEVSVGESLPDISNSYDLIVLWNYRKIVKNASFYNNIILFHSSNLPKGKGWAPIYNTFARKLEYYTITGIKAAEEVDSGDIIVKAKFRIQDNYTAENLRRWDNKISIILTKMILEKYDGKEIIGKKQAGKVTFSQRRVPGDNEISMDAKFCDIINHLRGVEDSHPAFFYYNDIKYIISVKPDEEPTFPHDLEIVFPRLDRG